MSPAKIDDVAKLAKVSTATVSRVLNNTDKVREKTRKRVLDACAELDYSPNPIARRLSLGRTHIIAIVLPFLTLPSLVERLRGVQHALDETKYDLVPFSVGTPEKREARMNELSRKSRADGLMLISVPPTKDQAKRILTEGIPTILMDAYHPGLHRMILDDTKGGYLATKHLIELGHQKIAFVSDYMENPMGFSSMRKRYQGYRKALEESNIPFQSQFHKQGEHGREEAQKIAIELLQLPSPPTAIFAASDTQAIGVIDAAQKLGVEVPKELSIVGYDGIRDAEYVNLTTIEQPLFESGTQAAELLLQVIEDPPSEPIELRIPNKLIIRGTTAPVPS